MKYIQLLRVKHYIKNMLIFLPVVFGMHLLELDTDLRMMVGVLAFSLMSSVVYILNDIKDVEKDRMHYAKKNRPIASGRVSIRNAYSIAILLFVLSIMLNYIILIYGGDKIKAWIMLIGYLLINVAYSLLNAKAVPLLDVILLMSGFVVRVYYGSALSQIPVSDWMCLVVCSAAFYMGFGKRRNELSKYSGETRQVLQFYTREFLDHAMNCCMTLTITFYSLWVLTQVQTGKTAGFIWSISILMVILFKYSMDIENTEGRGGGDPVEVIMADRMLIVLAIGFVFYLGICLYF